MSDEGRKRHYISEQKLWEFMIENAVEIDPEIIDLPPRKKPESKSTESFSLVWPSNMLPYVTQWYGANRHLYERWGLPGHEGLDIRAYTGTPVLAAAAGKIIKVAHEGNYGTHIRIEHQHDGRVFETVYGHLQKVAADAYVGHYLDAGRQIGLANNTGNSSGPHLHFSLKLIGVGKDSYFPKDIINPVPYFVDLWPGDGWRVVVGSNVRTEPNLKAKLITYAGPGTVVDALDFKFDWWKISLPDHREGWTWQPGYKMMPLA